MVGQRTHQEGISRPRGQLPKQLRCGQLRALQVAPHRRAQLGRQLRVERLLLMLICNSDSRQES